MRSSRLTVVGLGVMGLGLLGAVGPGAAAPAPAGAPAVQDGRRDFDFCWGDWRVRNRRLKGRLQGSTEWEEFEARVTARPLPTGLGSQDVYRTEHWPGFVGMSLRLFDPQARAWSIYWVDSRTGVLQPPVVGAFAGDVGVFEGPDTLAGRPITVRYTWSSVRGSRPRWEQAFSPDGGRTWETNWVMEFERDGVPGPAVEPAR